MAPLGPRRRALPPLPLPGWNGVHLPWQNYELREANTLPPDPC